MFFLFRAVWNFFLYGLAAIGLWTVLMQPFHGKTIYRHVKDFISTPTYKEGVADLKVLVSGMLNDVSEEVREDVSSKDQKELQEMLEKEVEKMKQQKKINEF